MSVGHFVKCVLPDRPVRMRVLRGPLRGATVMLNPRCSLRKIFGLYEHELNHWLDTALRRVDRVIDVGANDGYFTFGCAAALRRFSKVGEIQAFEPQEKHFRELQQSAHEQRLGSALITVIRSFVGKEIGDGVTTLDALLWKTGEANNRRNTLIKIDVEGGEMDVLAGAGSWLNPTNCFVIEVHHREFLERITSMFAEVKLTLELVRQQPLPLLGREKRDEANWWLVSHLGAAI